MLNDILNGLNIEATPIQKIYLSVDEKLIEWPSGNRMLLQEIPQRGYKITYSSEGRIIVLNGLTQHNTDFYLTDGYCGYLLSGPSQSNIGHPEVLIPLVKTEKDESQMFEVFHEIGHDNVKQELHTTRNKIDLGENVASYIGREMMGIDSNDKLNEDYINKWEERQAWFYALKKMRELDIKIPGLDGTKKILDRVSGHLKTYLANYSSKYP